MPKYVKKPITIEAVELKFPTTITTPTGVQKANPGDFLVSATGEQFFVPKAQFELTYELADIPDVTSPLEITNLSVIGLGDTTVEFEFNTPVDADFSSVNIYVDGVFEEMVDYIGLVSVEIDNLLPNTLYNFEFKTQDTSGNESSGISQVITTHNTPIVTP